MNFKESEGNCEILGLQSIGSEETHFYVHSETEVLIIKTWEVCRDASSKKGH